MKIVLKTLSVLLISWIALAVTTSGISGLVLCIGSDASLSLALASETHCRETNETHDHQQHAEVHMLAGTGAEGCGACIDVPLSSKTVSPLTEKMRRHVLTGNSVFHSSVRESTVGSDTDILKNRIASLQKARKGLPSSILAQRTVLLRI